MMRALLTIFNPAALNIMIMPGFVKAVAEGDTLWGSVAGLALAANVIVSGTHVWKANGPG
ncbi:MAG: hypothetical protein MRY79_08930 [Alphaproteobacteria bacterium]|nr:hypothetical protein [Alphaproteobacteria bacterium]